MSLNKISYFTFCLFFSVNFSLSAQLEAKEGNEIKNYLNVWRDSGINDTLRLESLNKAIWLLRNYNIDTALFYCEKSLELAKKKKITSKIARAINIKGVIFSESGRVKEALELYQESLKLYQEINDLRGITIENNNLGTIYSSANENQKAFNTYRENHNLFNLVKDTSLEIVTLNNLSYESFILQKPDSGLYFLKEAINLSQKHSESYDLSGLYRRMASHLISENQIDSAKIFLNKAYNLDVEKNNLKGQAAYFSLLAEVLFDEMKYEKSLKMVNKALKLTNELNGDKGDLSLYFFKYNLFKKLKNSTKALKNYELYNELKDTLEKLSADQEVVKIKYNQEYETKKQLDSLKHLDEILVQQAETKAKEEEIKTQKIIEGVLFVGIILVIGFLGLVYKQLNTTKKQKLVIEEKQQEITDSINYAKRIQDAMMTSSVYLKDTLPKSFIFFKPKDVVSGDFYWIYKDQQENIFFTVADCTGHGVPGAFMSMIGTSLLNEIIIEKGIKNTDKILFEMRTQIIKSLNQEEEGAQKDGMDISLCKLNMKNKIVEFSGAHNSLIHISEEKLKTYRGDHQPVGLLLGDKKPFTKHKVKLKKGDMLYIYSDGYQDQFGGQKGKKYMAAKFKKQLLKMSKENEQEQLVMLDEEFSSWINNYEQIDDVCVMGVRIT